ncbi:MAG: thioredoxin [Clostridia bacterium]|nr:thioredoxin [Clostridia bacterium]
MVKHVNQEQLEELVKGNKTVFCDFWASWCGPCRMLAPVFESVAEKYGDKAEFVKVNVDEEEALAVKYGISSIPNVLAIKGGKVAGNSLGFVPAPTLAAFIEKNL